MAEETIYCPSCNQKVRVPVELLGQPVQCPLCKLVFTAPVRGPAAAPGEPPVVMPAPVPPPGTPAPPPGEPADLHETVLMRIRPAASALLLTGILGWLLSAWSVYVTKASGVAGAEQQREKTLELLRKMPPSEFVEGMKEQFEGTTPETLYESNLTIGLVFTVVSAGVVIGAIQMLRLRMYWLAVFGSFLAMVNMMNCCCVLGFPVGTWSLSVLLRPEVRRAFE